MNLGQSVVSHMLTETRRVTSRNQRRLVDLKTEALDIPFTHPAGAFCPGGVFCRAAGDEDAEQTWRFATFSVSARIVQSSRAALSLARRGAWIRVPAMSSPMIRKLDAGDREPTDPTPDQIRERAAEVRRRWSSRVHQSRKVTADPTWSPPLVMTVEILRVLNAKTE
jgi:hypothetical protein